MYTMKAYLGFAIIVLGMCFSQSALANEEKALEAVKAAKAWVTVVDAQQYGKSWDMASVLFKNATTKKQWEQAMAAVKKPLGKTVSRELLSKTYTTSLPGAPDGEYVVIQFTSSFENKKSAIETITPMLDPDGQWRVSGYFIK